MDQRRISEILKTLDKSQKGLTMLGQLSKGTKFSILISTILSARARDETTIVIARELMKKYPTPKKLADAPLKCIEKIIKKSGFYRQKAKYVKETARMIHTVFNDKVPEDYEGLCSLPGVGRKVAGCVLVYGHGLQAIPVDTHVHRISNRVGIVRTKTPAETEKALLKKVPKKHWNLVNEVFVLHGKGICKPINPLCDKCPIKKYCDYYRKHRKSS